MVVKKSLSVAFVMALVTSLITGAYAWNPWENDQKPADETRGMDPGDAQRGESAGGTVGSLTPSAAGSTRNEARVMNGVRQTGDLGTLANVKLDGEGKVDVAGPLLGFSADFRRAVLGAV